MVSRDVEIVRKVAQVRMVKPAVGASAVAVAVGDVHRAEVELSRTDKDGIARKSVVDICRLDAARHTYGLLPFEVELLERTVKTQMPAGPSAEVVEDATDVAVNKAQIGVDGTETQVKPLAGDGYEAVNVSKVTRTFGHGGVELHLLLLVVPQPLHI